MYRQKGKGHKDNINSFSYKEDIKDEFPHLLKPKQKHQRENVLDFLFFYYS